MGLWYGPETRTQTQRMGGGQKKLVEMEDDVCERLKWENKHPTTNGNFRDGTFFCEVIATSSLLSTQDNNHVS